MPLGILDLNTNLMMFLDPKARSLIHPQYPFEEDPVAWTVDGTIRIEVVLKAFKEMKQEREKKK